MSEGVERVAASERLRIAVLGDFDGVHTRSWVRWYIERGHDVHCVSYYAPREPVGGATVHVLRAGAPLSEVGQLLRHRSQLSTSVYAKIDYARLALVARPWPLPAGTEAGA